MFENASKASLAVLALWAFALALVLAGFLTVDAHAVITSPDALEFPESYDDEVAMRDYASDIWSNHADLSWYEGHRSDEVYEIKNAKQLAGLAVLVTKHGIDFEGKTVRLANDIDLSNHQWFPIGCNEANYWGMNPFKGTFDGAGHAIRNLFIENAYHGQALFGEVRDATICNFTVYGSVTTGWQAAGVVAESERSTIRDIVSYVDVRTLFKSGDGGYSSTAGGIVAYVFDAYVEKDQVEPSRLENLKNYGKVLCGGITEQGGGVGGIAGSLGIADDGLSIVVSQCENHGSVEAEASNYTDMYIKGVGGIVGSTATYGSYQIIDCSNDGEVTSANLPSTGGIAGSISGLASSIEYCYNAGSVAGSSPEEVAAAGGIVGRHVSAHTGNTSFSVTSCYNVGSVEGNGENVSAILGTTSGFSEDWIDNDTDAGTTVTNDSNYYLEGSVAESSQTGVLFQRGMVEMGQAVSLSKMNSQEVIDKLNSTDDAQDHYVAGDASPKLELSGASGKGADASSKQGEGADDATLGEVPNASQKETHLYAIRADLQSAEAQTGAENLAGIVIAVALVALIACGAALQGGYYRGQMRPLRAVETGAEQKREPRKG